jgi:hypothetical protein
MASTSGTYAWSLIGDELLTEVWERLGKNPSTLNADVVRSMMRSVPLMLIDWTNRGLNLWQVDQQATTLAAGTNTVTAAPATTDILEAWVTGSDGVNRMMAAISRDEYTALPLPNTQSTTPTQYWVERVNPNPIIHVYPVPSASITLTYSRVRLPQDFTSLGQNADAPNLWAEAIVAGLAAKMALKFAADRFPTLKGLAEEAYSAAAIENRERVPLTILPDMW